MSELRCDSNAAIEIRAVRGGSSFVDITFFKGAPQEVAVRISNDEAMKFNNILIEALLYLKSGRDEVTWSTSDES